MSKTMKRVVIGIIIFFVIVVGFNAFRNMMMKKFLAKFANATVTISSATATAETWEDTLSAVGTLVAINGVSVSPEVAGLVTGINFNSGQVVKAGQALIQLDDQPDQQDLKNYQAQMQLAKLNFQRLTTLVTKQASSQSDLDNARAQLQEAQSMVEKTQVLINQKNIKAPFDGRIGVRQVNLGQYVSPGDALVSLQSLNPLYVNFSIPENALASLTVGQKINIGVDAFPNEKFPGTLTAINSMVDPNTRNILLQATIDNPSNKLYPGMFANVTVELATASHVIAIPQTAIAYSLYGDSVFVLTETGKNEKGEKVYKATRHMITIGKQQDNQVAVLKGLKAGDLVVSAGQLKLQDGMSVTINNDVNLQGTANVTLY